MKVIGFNLDEMHSKKSFDFKHMAISTDVLFTEVEKTKVDLIKDNEALKIEFKFTVSYKDSEKKDSQEKNEVTISGNILLMVSKEEAKDFLKSWKSKEIPRDKALTLYNFVLKKCSIKALQLEEDTNLPFHIPFPQIHNQNQDTQQK